jgi:hypothetical protein
MSGISTLHVNFPNIVNHRQRLFALNTKVILDETDYLNIWPYISNVWSFKNKNSLTVTTPWTDHYYHCQFKRAPDAPIELILTGSGNSGPSKGWLQSRVLVFE